MKYSLIYIFLSLYAICGFSQKPPIDSSVFGHWPSVEDAKITDDGKYALYFIKTIALGKKDNSILVLQATDNHWKIEIQDIESEIQITSDNKRAIFTNSQDSLEIVTLGTASIEYINQVGSFTLPKKDAGEWLVYQLNNPTRELRVHNFVTGIEKSFQKVTDYKLNEQGNALVLQTELEKDSQMTLQYLNLADYQATNIWSGTQASSFVFDESGTQLAFRSGGHAGNPPDKSLWYYQLGTNKAQLLANSLTPGIDSGLHIDDIEGFSRDGRSIFFSMKANEEDSKPSPDAVKVDIWSYKDTKLQSQQLNEVDLQRSYASVIHIDDSRIIRLEKSNDYSRQRNGDIVLIDHTQGDADPGEWKWNIACRHNFNIVSIKDGSRKSITRNFASLSPKGKYVIYYDPKLKNYFSYQVALGIIRNITRNIPTTWTEYDNDHPDAAYAVYGPAGWTEDDTAVLLYDQSDIWQVDPAGNKPPLNLTHGYGYKHNIVFRLSMNHREMPIPVTKKLLLTAFNRKNKDNGFYSITPGKGENPDRLTMGAYIYHIPFSYLFDPGEPPLKAKNAEAYVIRRMSAAESPNYFFTTDLKVFIPLSNVHPEKNYNWLKTELVTWETLDRNTSQGVLYKPENFDQKKKYPIIFYYYERLSDQLNVYLKPKAAYGPINIPWFVSNGYLVFTPDIHYKIGEIGESAVNSIVSAAHFFSKISWIDARHMGIQGHSFGGYETNYVITHTGLFAAAMSAAGPSDCISDYGSLWGGGASKMAYYETGGGRMSAALWERPDLYIKNSPIFQVDKVTTPLLMMNNKNDGGVPFAQGVEFFLALRRLGKKAWMLQYDGENHTIDNDKACKDYTIRLTQFFDHYLKGTPAPKWMTEGIPARRKGIDDGLKFND